MEIHALFPPRPLALYPPPELFHDSEILRWALRFYLPLFSQILNRGGGSAWNSIDQKCSYQGTRSCPVIVREKKCAFCSNIKDRFLSPLWIESGERAMRGADPFEAPSKVILDISGSKK